MGWPQDELEFIEEGVTPHVRLTTHMRGTRQFGDTCFGTPIGMSSKTHGRGRGYHGMPLSKPRDPHAFTIFDSGPKWRNHTQAQASPIGAVNPGTVQLKTGPSILHTIWARTQANQSGVVSSNSSSGFTRMNTTPIATSTVTIPITNPVTLITSMLLQIQVAEKV
ncbi:hypothetical protein GIB67_012541 [Kingdonia uniflora]|uniref:Uncharacterized protein n=1 Tax=Kingdonia uniflora TaxID=39325 RepID=A0A7J7N5L6_9MAGN|nr:hypothetical protein GIB67_012541 [Kingdonia uniflora]